MTTESIAPASQHTVTVTGYGAGGAGVARLGDGRVVFIRIAARGDVLEVGLVSEQARSARAEIVRVLAPSPHRIEPDCPFYPDCGGCDFRHISYEEELWAKLKRVNDAMSRIGGLSARASEVLRTGQVSGYRNKAVFHTDGHSIGFYRAQSHEVIPIDHCLLLKSDLNAALRSLAHGGEISLRTAKRERAAQSGKITLRSGRNGLSMPIEEELGGLIFRVSGFFQVNTGAALLLYQKARELAGLSKNDTLVDLYCGVGTLTLFVGQDAGYALGVEQNSEAVEAAWENARRNGMPHVSFICADAAKWDAEIAKPDCIIVDPPRRGLSPGTIRKMLDLSPGRIVYLSCDPATLARDLKNLEGYTVTDICAVDMFPRTANVECCCLLLKG